MKRSYSFLTDPSALDEIKKHKWLVSEAKGREVGFATAAVEWIRSYGEDYLRYRRSLQKDNLFVERRRARRFVLRCPVTIQNEKQTFSTESTAISLNGLSCLRPPGLTLEKNEIPHFQVTVCFLKEVPQHDDIFFSFSSPGKTTKRSTQMPDTLFFPFSDEAKDFLRNHEASFKKVLQFHGAV